MLVTMFSISLTLLVLEAVPWDIAVKVNTNQFDLSLASLVLFVPIACCSGKTACRNIGNIATYALGNLANYRMYVPGSDYCSPVIMVN